MSSYVEHAWATAVPTVEAPQPSAFRATFLSEGPFHGYEPDVAWIHEEQRHQIESVELVFTLASANVLTLHCGAKRQQDKGMLDLGRSATLQRQCSEVGIHILGLQETRTSGALTRHSASHYVFQSGASTEQHRGCELWIDRNHPYARGPQTEFCFEEKHFHIMAFSDRYLFVHVHAPHLKLRILVLHAPHAEATDCHHEEWWQHISQLIQQHAPSLPLVILGDFNARFGNIVTEAVSNFDCEDETDCSHAAHVVLLEHELWLPATFHDIHTGDSVTWISTYGQAHRLDYVALPMAWQAFHVLSYVQHQVDLALARQDHFVTAVDVRFTVAKSPHCRNIRTHIDANKCHHSQNRQQFIEFLQHAPTIPWACGIGQHAELLTQWLSEGATKCFPREKAQPRQRYLSETTWSVIQVRKLLAGVHRRTSCQLQRLRRKQAFRRWFDVYAKQSNHHDLVTHSTWFVASSHIAKQLTWISLWTLVSRRSLHPIARQLSRADRVQAVAMLADRFIDAVHSKETKQMYRTLRPLLGQAHRKSMQSFRPIPAVRLANNDLASTPAEAAERWRSHFAQPEGGTPTTVAALQHEALVSMPCYDFNEVPFDITALPTVLDIERFLLKAKPRKAAGLDGLPSEIYRIAVPQVARILWPLLMKVSIRCQEPIRWKGGEVCALPKSQHTGHVADKFRSILLTDFVAKLSHGLVRQKLLPRFADYKVNMQAGGVPGLGTDILNLFLQSHAQYAKTAGLSSAAVFIDIQQAFYRACRHLLVRPCRYEIDLVQIFVEQGWPPSLYHEFCANMRAPTSLDAAKVSPHLQAQVQSMLSHTWFQLRGNSSTLTKTTSGTKPGDAIADMLYAFLMTRFLKDLRAEFVKADLHFTLPLRWIPPCALQEDDLMTPQLIDAAWVDDLVLLLQADSPASIVAKVRTAISIAYDKAAALNLRLNMTPDKTSALLALRGTDARKTWTDLLQHDMQHPYLVFECAASSHPLHLPIVADYIYLGVLQTHQGHPAAEVKRRFLIAKPILHMLSKGVFRSNRVPTQTRRTLCKAFLFSKVAFGAGAWQQMHVHTMQHWHNGLIHLVNRVVTRTKRGPGICNLDLVADSQLPHPMLVLCQQRVNLFSRVMNTEMVELFSLLQAQQPESSWLSMVCEDLQRIQHLVPDDAIQEVSSYAKVDLLARMCVHNPKALNRFVQKAVAIYAKYLRIWVIFRDFQRHIQEDLAKYGIIIAESDEPRPRPRGFACHECAAEFDSFGALCTHVFKKHNQGNLAPRFAPGNTCRACLKCYRGRTQLIHHLKYFRTKCLLKLMVSVPPLSDAELQELQDNEAAERKAHKGSQRTLGHKMPVIQASGPRRPWPWMRTLHSLPAFQQDSPIEEDDSWIFEVFASLQSCNVHDTLEILTQKPFTEVYLEQIMHVFSQSHCESGAVDVDTIEQHLVLQESLALWQENHLREPVKDFYPIQLSHAAVLCQQLRIPQHHTSPHVPSMTERRQQAQDRMWTDAHVPTQIRIQLDRADAVTWTWPLMSSRLLVRQPVYLYVFSGRRRQGDYQFHVEDFCRQYSEDGRVLLVDLALSPLHDVTNMNLMNTFLEWFRCGFIAALMVAPPCETWSQARHNKIAMQKTPRPLRSSEFPFGLDGLTSDELDQVFISSLLLFVALRLFLAAIVHQVPGTLEHPHAPAKLERASIWFLPWLKRFRTHTAVRLVAIHQAEFGAGSLKPTHLLCCWLPDWEVTVKQHKTPILWHKLDTLIGLNGEGHWKTSSAKEYPADLNRALAHAHVFQVSQQRSTATSAETLPHHVSSFKDLYSGDSDLTEQAMQPDYAKNSVVLDGLD
eukprot:Skav230858  [mRNA]  locus=scaffold1335:27242:32707:+ [translate_table: standard]